MVVTKPVPKKKVQKPALKKKQATKFSITCSPGVIDEDIISTATLGTYLKKHIKVNNKLNNLGKDVHVEHDRTSVNVAANIPLSKRYLKYLTKKFLKLHRLRDYLRVVAKGKEAYELKFYNFETEDTDDEN